MRIYGLSFALLASLLFAGIALAQDGESSGDVPPAVAAPTADDAAKPDDAPAPSFAFAASLDEARASAKAAGKPLLIVAVPDWYESPGWERLEKAVLATDGTSGEFAPFVGVVVKESRDHEVHVRHRVSLKGYPLAVVLDSEGRYLGHTSGTPTKDDEAGWMKRIAAIPPRAKEIAALRAQLTAASDEDPALLFDLGKLLADAGEADRADALFERMERADPLGPAERIGEARYLRLRHQVLNLLESRKFGDIEPLCLRWRRRFSSHARLPEILLLQANSLFLTGKADDARELWQTLIDDHADSDAAKTATEALEKLKD